jgi:hypothetical protein
MHTYRVASAIAVATAIVAGGLVLSARAPSDEAPKTGPPDEPLTIAFSDTPALRTGAPAPLRDAQVVAKVRELEAMSETFRNSTFLIAIRDAGYVCNELLRVYGGFDESGKWTATCSAMLAYTVGVAGNGALRVEPMNVYWDGVTRPVNQQSTEPLQPLRDSIPVPLPTR